MDIDYVFVPRRFGRWYVSPNLKGVAFVPTDKKSLYPDGWEQPVEYTKNNGLLSSGVYDTMCNQGPVWFMGKDHLPPPRPVHELTPSWRVMCERKKEWWKGMHEEFMATAWHPSRLAWLF